MNVRILIDLRFMQAGAAAAAGWIWANAFGKFGKMAFAAKYCPSSEVVSCSEVVLC